MNTPEGALVVFSPGIDEGRSSAQGTNHRADLGTVTEKNQSQCKQSWALMTYISPVKLLSLMILLLAWWNWRNTIWPLTQLTWFWTKALKKKGRTVFVFLNKSRKSVKSMLYESRCIWQYAQTEICLFVPTFNVKNYWLIDVKCHNPMKSSQSTRFCFKYVFSVAFIEVGCFSFAFVRLCGVCLYYTKFIWCA